MKKKLICIMLISLFTAVVFGLEYNGIAYEQWKTVLENGSLQEKVLALEAIGNISAPETEELLMAYLDNENDELRLTAVWALGQINSAMAAEKICWMMGTENDPRIDGALVNIGSPAVDFLILKLKLATLLNHFEEGTRIARILIDIQSPSGMVEVASYLSRLLSIPENRDDAKRMLSMIGDRAIEPLQISLQTTYNKELIQDILKTLLLIESERTLDTFYKYVSDTDPAIRALVANALGRIKSSNNTDFLISMLRDENENVRTQALVSLGEMQDSKAVVYILTSLKDENPLIRAMAAYALGQIRDVRAVYPLINLLDDRTVLSAVNPSTGRTEEQYVLDFAARALIRINDSRGIEELEKRGIKVVSE
ncbi:MAG TPA: HEAT repeat domain-containing protein [Thermotogota bacterium]|nr:HEAT repeat domain-containing protein [Thermotogota bacterium]HRW35495.1 HEAT repeat domain-containing protein [Thermotogota bacterium]